jgi:hypothetical protein
MVPETKFGRPASKQDEFTLKTLCPWKAPSVRQDSSAKKAESKGVIMTTDGLKDVVNMRKIRRNDDDDNIMAEAPETKRRFI